MEWWHVYLFTRLDVLNSVVFTCFICSVLLMIITIFTYIIWKTDDEESAGKFCKQSAKFSIPMIVISTILMVVIPTQKEAAAIYLIPKIVNSEAAKEASKIPADVAKLIRLKMEEWISNLEPKKKSKD